MKRICRAIRAHTLISCLILGLILILSIVLGVALGSVTIPFGQVWRIMLERILNGEPPTQRGRRTDIERRKAAREKQLPPKERKQFSFTAHDLRHTYATALYDAGVPVKAAQYFLGHADIRVTLDLYTHLSKEREAASHASAKASFME